MGWALGGLAVLLIGTAAWIGFSTNQAVQNLGYNYAQGLDPDTQMTESKPVTITTTVFVPNLWVTNTALNGAVTVRVQGYLTNITVTTGGTTLNK